MKKLLVGILGFVVIVGLNAPAALAYHCPKLVAECQALVAKLEKRKDVNQEKLAEAKAGCAEALKLHEAGKHKESVIKVGEAIEEAGESVQ